jgi:ATP-dependent 26S proteasome regulatory subunit
VADAILRQSYPLPGREERAEVRNRDELGEEQRGAYDEVIADPGKSIFVTGPAGCGKTEVLKAVRARYPKAVVTAPTGR